MVRNHRVKFTLQLGRHAARGRYTIRLSIDAGGTVGALTRSAMVR